MLNMDITKHLFLISWVVFTTCSQQEFEDKLNFLQVQVMWQKTTRIMQSGESPKYTIIYWKR